jgi:hypothetical protein
MAGVAQQEPLMNEAIVVFSRKGLFKTIIKAREIPSREQARKLWPLIAPDSQQMVTWISPTFENGRVVRRSHFRLLPNARAPDLKQHFEEEESTRHHYMQESEEHLRAKQLIAAELNRRLEARLGMPWWFKDINASDYPLEGNLLLGANAIVTEHPLSTPFGSSFRLDVAVLGPPIDKTPMVLGGIEIERGHAFDGRKALIGKSLGFPLISIDITDMSLTDITPEWAYGALTATTHTHEKGRRQTYIYLHDLLYPLFAQLPKSFDTDQRHQYIVFADDKTLGQLMGWFNHLGAALTYSKQVIVAQIVNGKSSQSRLVLERAGEILGPDWQSFNKDKCLLLTVPRPTGPTDLQAHRFHLTMARLLLSHVEALVGYKYTSGIRNNEPSEDIWTIKKWDSEEKTITKHRVLPKRLAEPINRLMLVVSELQRLRNAISDASDT